jgi:hypothetical protein
MERVYKFLYVMIALAMAHVPVVAQQNQLVNAAVPPWVPESGYWVAENNLGQPKLYTIYFYTNDHVLIYKEKIEGITLNLQLVSVKMRLKKVLETSLRAWQKQQRAKDNEGLVINLLQGR